MLFPIGTKVVLIHLNEKGTVTGWMEHDMLRVKLDESGMEIPAFPGDLERCPEIEQPPSKAKARFVPGKKEVQPELPPEPEIESQYIIIKSMGIQLAFEPILQPNGTASEYTVHLINDTGYDVLFHLEIGFDGKVMDECNGHLRSMEAYIIDTLLYDELNDNPSYQFKFQKITTEGAGPFIKKMVKIKPKSFFANKRIAPILNKEVHHYKVLPNFDPPTTSAKEDLKTYTKKNTKAPNLNSYGNHINFDFRTIDIEEVAAFSTEKDLHIEKLVDDVGAIPRYAILPTQIQHLKFYIEKAISLSVERVFIIHGVGEGKLKAAVALALEEYTEIKSFNNNYHPKYGFGATEVIFKKS